MAIDKESSTPPMAWMAIAPPTMVEPTTNENARRRFWGRSGRATTTSAAIAYPRTRDTRAGTATQFHASPMPPG